MQLTTGYGGVIARLGEGLSWYTDKELNSVLTTVQRHTQFMDSPVIAHHLTTSSFDPKQLRSDERVTLYLCLPPQMLVTLAPLQRMWIGSILRITTRDRVDERNPLLFLIDEAAHLGPCQALEDAVTLMRGMGIRLWFFWQSLGQLQKCYGDRAQAFLDNMDTQQYFGTNAFDSAEAIAKRIGEQTITVSSHDRSSSRSKPLGGGMGQPKDVGSASSSSSSSTSKLGRQLLKPEEILGLPGDVALVFHRNLPVVAAQLVRYFDAPEFCGGRPGKGVGLGLAAFFQAACLLLTGIILTAGGFTCLADPSFQAAGLSASLPAIHLSDFWPKPSPQRIEAARHASVEAAVRLAAERHVEMERSERRGVPVPHYLSREAIDAELRASITTANALAERQMREASGSPARP